MKNMQIVALLALALSVSVGAYAQPALPLAGPSHTAVGVNAVGHWLYNEQGDTIGSVRRLTDGDQTAVLMIGNYLRPGSYETRVPASNLSIVNEKVILKSETVLALSNPSHR